MNIQVSKNQIGTESINSVNARELYLDLEMDKSQWARWSSRNIIEDNFFTENKDYLVLDIMSNTQGGRPYKDFIISLDMAKHICMLARTEKAHDIRKYFIECEKQLREQSKPATPLTIQELLEQNVKVIGDLNDKVVTLEYKIEQDKPMLNFAKAISGTTSNVDFETFAKALYDTEGLKYGRNTLMKWFRDNNYLMKNNKPYQTMLDRGLMSLKEGSYINQSTNELVTYTQSRITGKGQMYFTNKLLDENNNKENNNA